MNDRGRPYKGEAKSNVALSWPVWLPDVRMHRSERQNLRARNRLVIAGEQKLVVILLTIGRTYNLPLLTYLCQGHGGKRI